MTQLTAAAALDAYYLEARAKLLDLAAIFDRIDRGGAGAPVADPRLDRLRRGLHLLLSEGPGRTEAVQTLFSHQYDPSWPIPAPKSA